MNFNFIKPSDKAKNNFSNFFGKAQMPIFALRVCCHVGSALFGIFVIKPLIESSIEGVVNVPALVIIASALAWVTFIEFIFSLSIRYSIRQLLSLRFANLYYVIFFLTFSSVGFLVFQYSLNLSEDGGAIKGKELVRLHDKKPDTFLLNERDSEKQKIENEAYQLIEIIRGAYKTQIQATKSSYNSQIREKEAEHQYHKKRASQGIKWAPGWVEKTRKQKNRLISERDAKLATLKTDESNEILQASKDKTLALSSISDSYKSKIQDHNEKEEAAFQATLKKQNLFSGWGMRLGFIFVAAAAVFYLLEEVYLAGAGKEVSQKEYQKRDNLLLRYSNVIIELFIRPQVWILRNIETWLNIDINKDGFIGTPPDPQVQPGAAPHLSPVRYTRTPNDISAIFDMKLNALKENGKRETLQQVLEREIKQVNEEDQEKGKPILKEDKRVWEHRTEENGKEVTKYYTEKQCVNFSNRYAQKIANAQKKIRTAKAKGEKAHHLTLNSISNLMRWQRYWSDAVREMRRFREDF